jgi:hypothetical protein
MSDQVMEYARDRNLEQAIERQIDLRTWRRVHNLCVEAAGGRVVVHGCASSYYVKQLALLGVLDVLQSADPDTTELDIEVCRM